jgi:hypothetical protein
MPRGFALITGSVSASGALKKLMLMFLGSVLAAGGCLGAESGGGVDLIYGQAGWG